MSILVVALFVIGASVIYSVFSKKPASQANNNQTQVTQKELSPNGCLEENEIADYDRASLFPEITQPKERSPLIFVKNRNTGVAIKSFRINNVRDSAYPMELHKCGVYFIQDFNYDNGKGLPLPNYRGELWQYGYNNEGGKLLMVLFDFGKEDNLNNNNYSPTFRVSPLEQYIALEKGYLGQDDYALIIKDLKTLKDVFVLSAKSTFDQYPNMAGSFGFDTWTDDSRYFWGDIFDGAYVNGYFRIDTQNWKAEIFEAPNGAMGGSPLNVNTGYLPIQPGQVWTGDVEFDQELKEQHKREGKKSILYLYNLFTKEKKLIETTNEPIFWFKPEWLSDTELQYELPSGEKKIYKTNEK